MYSCKFTGNEYMYHVIETPMYPAKYKVEDKKWPGSDNSWCNYFRTRKAAQTEADKRNKAQQKEK